MTWNLFFSFSTCYFYELVAFADVQEVSYFSLLLIPYLFIILTQSVGSDVPFSLSPLATSVNLCIRICSVGKLLFITLLLLSLWPKSLMTWNLFFSFSTCYFYELVAFAYAQRVSYFSFIILTKNVVSDMKFVFSFSTCYFYELVHSLMLSV